VELRKQLRRKEYDNVRAILSDCQEGAVLIGNTIEQANPEQTDIIARLEAYCESLFIVHEELDKEDRPDDAEIKQKLDEQIKKISEDVKRNIRVILKVVFMPYKASMWTSLESVWRAANEDEECEAKVVVMPYYTLDSRYRKTRVVYEASLFPEYVPITHYSQFDPAAELPDMILIHNPYDDTNNVTRVPEQYYSYHLKKYTDMLVYSPYGMMGYYNPNVGSNMCCANAVEYADKVLVQSEKVKRIYMDHGVAADKLLALGSPKVDAIVENLHKQPAYPEGWEEKLQGRKVFLLNTHLSYFIESYNFTLKYPGKRDYAKRHHTAIFDQLLNREGCAFIWRPHPLMKTTLESREMYETLNFVLELERRIQESDNGVLDTTGDYNIAFGLSDALITTYSSMIPEYMISGKPIYIYQRRYNAENSRNAPVDYTNNYYKAKWGAEPQFPKFIDMVLKGEDPLYQERMADVHRAFSNLDGTIGRNVYRKLKEEIRR